MYKDYGLDLDKGKFQFPMVFIDPRTSHLLRGISDLGLLIPGGSSFLDHAGRQMVGNIRSQNSTRFLVYHIYPHRGLIIVCLDKTGYAMDCPAMDHMFVK